MLRDKCYCVRYWLVDDENSHWWRDDSIYSYEEDGDESWFEKLERVMREKYEKVVLHIQKKDRQLTREDLRKTFCDEQKNWDWEE